MEAEARPHSLGLIAYKKTKGSYLNVPATHSSQAYLYFVFSPDTRLNSQISNTVNHEGT